MPEYANGDTCTHIYELHVTSKIVILSHIIDPKWNSLTSQFSLLTGNSIYTRRAISIFMCKEVNV